MEIDRLAVNFIINVRFPTQLVHSPVEIDRYHQVPAKPCVFGFVKSMNRSPVRRNFTTRHSPSPQYLHPPNIKHEIDSSTRSPSTASISKTEEAEYATPPSPGRRIAPLTRKIFRWSRGPKREIPPAICHHNTFFPQTPLSRAEKKAQRTPLSPLLQWIEPRTREFFKHRAEAE